MRSYWLSASNYYVLSSAFAFATFFLVFAVLREGREEPWIPAGVAGSAVLIVAVVIRRAILRRHETRMRAARRLEKNILSLGQINGPESKLTIEQNASILRELKRKSDAATVLERFPEGHREVFELCGQYLAINKREMQFVSPGSPRIAALRKGREVAEDYHRRHMLRWAQIESTTLLEHAQAVAKPAERIAFARRALTVIEKARDSYPNETMLSDSAIAIDEFILNIKVMDLIDRAGRANTRGNLKQAEKLYRSALDQLETGSPPGREHDMVAEKIRTELERLTGSDLK
jgi:hypothetical protein